MNPLYLFLCLFVLVGVPSIAAGDGVAEVPSPKVVLREGDIAEISSIWSSFLAAAQTGDKEAALEFFNPDERAKGREVFDAVGNLFSDYINELAASEIIPIDISDDVALFALTPPCDETDKDLCKTYSLYFVNHPYLGWRLSSL